MDFIRFISYDKNGENSLLRKQHIHDDCYELLQVLDGNGNMLIDNRLYAMRPGSIYLIKPGILHNSAPFDESYRRNVLNVDARFLEEFCELSGSREELESLCERRYFSTGYPKVDRISEAYEKIAHGGSRLKVCAALFELLSLVSTLEDGEISEQKNEIADTLRYIDANLTEPLTLELLAERVFLSKYYFSHQFLKYTHMSPMRYITDKRLAHAKKLLGEPNISVSEAAFRAGFSSLSNFSVIFTKYVGVNPSEYRRRT